MLAQVHRSLCVAILVAGFATMLPNYALSGEPTSVVVLDLQQVDGQAKASKAARGEWKAYLRKFKSEVDREKKVADKEFRDLQKQKSILDPEVYKKKYAEFGRKVSLFNQKLQFLNKNVNTSYQKALGVIRAEVVKITEKIAKSKGADIVLQRGAVLLLLKEPLNITDAVIVELDKSLPTIKLDDPTKVKPNKAKAK